MEIKKLKNVTVEIKNVLDDMNSRLDTTRKDQSTLEII